MVLRPNDKSVTWRHIMRHQMKQEQNNFIDLMAYPSELGHLRVYFTIMCQGEFLLILLHNMPHSFGFLQKCTPVCWRQLPLVSYLLY